jgi:ceramide glucosyltransferase
MPLLHLLSMTIGFASLGAAAGYGLLNVIAVSVWRLRRTPAPAATLPPVTILKPLCGAEPGLYDDLRSFCRQDYPEFQIIFGVRDPADPACAVVHRLEAEFPTLPIELVVNPQLHGTNCKISNLINMLPYARHSLLAIADSDASVRPDYLATVTAPLRDPKVGLVTCVYRGVPTLGLWSRLGAMYINEWYVPSILLAWLFGHQSYVSGQTICLRRDTLRSFDDLHSLADHLADDYRLGELVRGQGLRIVLSPYLVSGEHHEPSLWSVARHETRWMRTLNVLRPLSFRCLFLTFSLPLAIIGIVLVCAASSGMAERNAATSAAWLIFAVAGIARLALHLAHRFRDDRPLFSDLWLLPARDLLLCWVWSQSFFTSQVTWRGNVFDVGRDGVMRRLS